MLILGIAQHYSINICIGYLFFFKMYIALVESPSSVPTSCHLQLPVTPVPGEPKLSQVLHSCLSVHTQTKAHTHKTENKIKSLKGNKHALGLKDGVGKDLLTFLPLMLVILLQLLHGNIISI